jgi:hypothetical protein
MKAQEWTWFAGATNAPSGQEEPELLELGRRVAMGARLPVGPVRRLTDHA